MRCGAGVRAVVIAACGLAAAPQAAETRTVSRPFLGVTHTRIDTTVPRKLVMNLVEIDLTVPGIGFAVTPSNGAAAGETVGRTTRQFLADQAVQVAINGGFSAWASGSNYNVEGLAARQGVVYSEFQEFRTFALNISANNVATIIRATGTSGTTHSPVTTLYNTLAGEARLLRDGTIINYANETLHPRTGVGLSADATRLFLMTIDGRNAGHSLGVTRPELADLMRINGVHNAINLDGGGSTTLVMADPVARVVNVPVGVNDVPGTERVVGSNFGVFALPMPAPAAITLTIASGTQTQWQAGQPLIVNALSLTKSGAGTLVLDQANPFTGPTTLTAGTVRLAHARGLAASPITIRSGATLAADPGVRPLIPSVALAGGTLAATDLTIGGTAGVGSLVVASGAFTGSPAITLLAGGRLTLPMGNRQPFELRSLAIDASPGGGLLDIGTSMVTVPDGGLAAADLVADLRAGQGDGSWNGTAGIASSAARGDIRIGWLTTPDRALSFAPAAAGDVTLDGIVDVLDAATLLSAGRYDTGLFAGWADGDFNYDGVADILDATDMLAAGLFDEGWYLPATSATVAVPEPSGYGWLTALGFIASCCFPWRPHGLRRQPRVQA